MTAELNISPDEKIAGVPLARLLRNLEETSYNEGAMDLACRLTDCKAVIEELLARRAAPSSSADELPPLPAGRPAGEYVGDTIVFTIGEVRQAQREAIAADRIARQGEPVARTFMTDEQAERWAWEQVKEQVGTEGWTAGDSCNYFGFFLWGWRYRAQYERQRAAIQAAAPAGAPTTAKNAAVRFDREDAREQQPDEAALRAEWTREYSAAWMHGGRVGGTIPKFEEWLSRRATGTDRARAGEDA